MARGRQQLAVAPPVPRRPAMGDMVHFVEDTPERLCRPAVVIAELPDGRGLSLCVFTEGYLGRGTVWRPSPRYSDAKEPGTWHWNDPAREAE